jgi:hypothetical protein
VRVRLKRLLGLRHPNDLTDPEKSRSNLDSPSAANDQLLGKTADRKEPHRNVPGLAGEQVASNEVDLADVEVPLVRTAEVVVGAKWETRSDGVAALRFGYECQPRKHHGPRAIHEVHVVDESHRSGSGGWRRVPRFDRRRRTEASLRRRIGAVPVQITLRPGITVHLSAPKARPNVLRLTCALTTCSLPRTSARQVEALVRQMEERFRGPVC